jgi:nitroimidazol reductase NimA-like FMN-containing flavoprotein (pyridoxamine 5'-phosphate oxidase superfamily)
MPTTELDARYGNPEATAVPWEQAEEVLAAAPLYWITTLRPDGRPHVTPLVAVWHDGAMYFRTGAEERKGRNLAANRTCLFTTGTNTLHSGTDLVLEGEAAQLTDDTAALQGVADAFLAKYGEEWHFQVEDGASQNGPLVYRVAPSVVHAFGKDPYSQTKYTF